MTTCDNERHFFPRRIITTFEGKSPSPTKICDKMMLTFYADRATLTARQQNSLRAQNTQLLQFHTSKITIASWVFYMTIKLGGREGAWAGMAVTIPC